MSDNPKNSTGTRNVNPNSLANLIPGNPNGGRRKIPEEFKELAQKNSIPALLKAIDIMNDLNAKTADRLKAIEIVLDRGIGKPTQAIEIGNKEGEEFKVANADLSHLTIEQIKELLNREDKTTT